LLASLPCSLGISQDYTPQQRQQASNDKKSLEELEKRQRERIQGPKEDDGRGMRLRSNRDEASKQEDLAGKAVPNQNPQSGDDEGNANDASVREAPSTAESDSQAMGQRLQLSDVIASTYRAFPLLEIARLQSGVTAGQQTSALGAYDVKLEYYSLNQPVGFYETYRNGIGVARQLWWGGYASAGYRIGRGSFEPWYKERETNGGGEFKVGLMQPLLQGRAIDPYRVELFQANLRRQAVGPEIQNQILIAGQDAAKAFWFWVEIGNVLKAQERLLEIAVKRGEQLERTKAAGAASNLELSLNAQQIHERQLKVNDTRQKFRDTAFKLSLFLRDEGGNPMLVPPEWLPSDFPEIGALPVGNFEADLQTALMSRPELSLIEIDRQSTRWDLSLARNQLLPNVDFALLTTQDVGAGTSSINDKGDFQVEAGVTGGVPIQRRKASGKILSTEQKLMQISQKAAWQRNKIEVELRTARNALDTAQQNVFTARELLNQANITVNIFRRSLAAGRTDLFFLLTQEIKVNDSEVKLLEAERDFFIALAAMQAALGLDPLEQAAGLVIP
jgi:outer membrane protein TolC